MNHQRYTLAAANVGRVALFINQSDSYNWSTDRLLTEAQWAKGLGVDTLLVKKADGENRWYNKPEEVTAQRVAINNVGLGYLPYTYSYGPLFQHPGNDQIAAEAAIALELAAANRPGGVCLDMEAEWNGHPDMASYLAGFLGPSPDLVYISTWADPIQQNWQDVVKALTPAVDAWGPQQYNGWLYNQEEQWDNFPAIAIEPELDLTQEFGYNNQYAIVDLSIKDGCRSFWFWENGAARANPGLARQLISSIKQRVPITKVGP